MAAKVNSSALSPHREATVSAYHQSKQSKARLFPLIINQCLWNGISEKRSNIIMFPSKNKLSNIKVWKLWYQVLKVGDFIVSVNVIINSHFSELYKRVAGIFLLNYAKLIERISIKLNCLFARRKRKSSVGIGQPITRVSKERNAWRQWLYKECNHLMCK